MRSVSAGTASAYQIRSRHRNQEVREVLPADYAGVLCSDRGRSYDARELRAIRQQKCLCHLQRSITELLESKWGRGRSLGLALQRLFQEALALWHAERAGTAMAFAAQAADLQARLTELLREPAAAGPQQPTPPR